MHTHAYEQLGSKIGRNCMGSADGRGGMNKYARARKQTLKVELLDIVNLRSGKYTYASQVSMFGPSGL